MLRNELTVVRASPSHWSVNCGGEMRSEILLFFHQIAWYWKWRCKHVEHSTDVLIYMLKIVIYAQNLLQSLKSFCFLSQSLARTSLRKTRSSTRVRLTFIDVYCANIIEKIVKLLSIRHFYGSFSLFLPRSISYSSTCRKIYRHIENSKIESTLMFFHFPHFFFKG